MKVLKARNEGGRPKVLNKTGTIVLKKDRYKRETSLRGNFDIVSKPSPERVMKSCLKCLKN